MKRNILKNIGTINIEKLEVIGGQLEVFIPVEVTSKELDAVLEKCEADFREKHPAVKEEISFNLNLVFSMGYANPEFELQIMLFDDSESILEEYDNYFIGDIELSEDQRKQIKKVMWDKMGEMFFNL